MASVEETIESETTSSFEDEPYVEQPTPEPTANTAVNQTINANAIFFNSGANGRQINNMGTINIEWGAKA
jgi:hypothetical protein